MLQINRISSIVSFIVFILLQLNMSSLMAMPYTCLYKVTDHIPVLNWEKRSDWLDITRDLTNPAIADDELDDTNAIQQALDKVGSSPGDIKVIYFPPGIYYLNKTLTLSERAGVMFVGHGKDTVLVWKGKKSGRMFWSNGLHRSVFKGLVWDGANTAAIGIDHQSKLRYETHIIHEDSEFRNFKLAGIRIGHNQKLATAEVFYRNLLFRNNRYGVLISSWNNYNNIFDGIHFYDNDIAVSAEKGNFVIRNTRFENSKETDLIASTHSHSIRRSVSTGSNIFLKTVKGPAVIGNVTLDNVLVSGWKNPNGVVFSSLRGPLIAFDTFFKHVDLATPPIVLDNHSRMQQTAVLSNVLFNGSGNTIKTVSGNKITNLKRPQVKPLVDINSRFLRQYTGQKPIVIDVKKDCGAKGDGKYNDSIAVKNCIQQALKNKDFTEVYFPSGIYRITSPLNRIDKNIALRGTGFHSILYWDGKPGDKLLSLDGTDGVSIKHLALESRYDTEKIVYEGVKPGVTRLHNVYGYYRDQNKTTRAFDISGAHKEAVLLADVLVGATRFSGDGQVNALLGISSSVFMDINGGSNDGGFIGVLSRVSCCSETPLKSLNNSSFIMSDWYNEQSDHLFEINGSDTKGQGRVSISFSKAESESAEIMTINNYQGTVNLMGGFFGYVPDKDSSFRMNVRGEDTILNVTGTMFRYQQPTICNENVTHCNVVGNIIEGGANTREIIDDRFASEDRAAIRSGFDDFRRLGQLDLKYNYCHNF